MTDPIAPDDNLQTAVDAAPEPAVALALSGRVLAMNDAARRLLFAGAAGAEATLAALFSTRPKAVADALKLWRGSGAPIPVRLPVEGAPDTPPFLYLEGWRWRREGGDVLMVRLTDQHDGIAKLAELTTLVDQLNRECTRRARVETQLRSLLTKLHAHNAARDDMLAQMSHDLRTPLNAVIGMSELMLLEPAGPLQPQYKVYVEDILHSGRSLLQLVEHVLALSVGTQHEEAAEAALFDLNDCLESCLELVRPLAQLRGAVLLTPKSMRLPRLRGDQILMRQILLNLFSNAVKHGGRGCRIEVRSDRTATGGVRLQIIDDGPGIAEEKLATLFERARNDPYVAAPKGGVGLFLTKRSADALGVALSIDSRKGAGVTARLDFPAEMIA